VTPEEDEKFFADFRKMQESLLPSKTKMAVMGTGVVLVNVVLFLGAVGVIALAVKWVISSQ